MGFRYLTEVLVNLQVVVTDLVFLYVYKPSYKTGEILCLATLLKKYKKMVLPNYVSNDAPIMQL